MRVMVMVLVRFIGFVAVVLGVIGAVVLAATAVIIIAAVVAHTVGL